jgi:hypothetical protein
MAAQANWIHSVAVNCVCDQKPDNFAWWHWLPNSWIIIDHSGQLTASSLRNKVKKVYPGVHNFVTEVKDDSWVGFGPGGDSTYFKWLKSQWNKG